MVGVSTVNFLGYDMVNCDMRRFIGEVIVRLRAGEKGITISCLNPHSFMTARSDAEFEIALKSSSYLIPDGVGVVIGARLLGHSVHGRITGSDIFSELLAALSQNGGGNVHFIGSTDATLKSIAGTVKASYPRVTVVGLDAPPFGAAFDDGVSDSLASTLRSTNPDILWVGMTAPKQEKWIARYVPRDHVGVAAGIGAVFDFVAGNKRRAPKLIQILGMEWVFRLALEPRRLWRRTVISGVLFLLHVLAQRLRVKRQTT